MSTPKHPKHPEHEDEDEKDVEPLADPEPDDAWPPVKEPKDDEYDPPDKKAAVTPTIRENRGALLVAVIEERRAGDNTFEMSGPHHS